MSDPLATLALVKWLRDRCREWEAEAKADLQMLPNTLRWFGFRRRNCERR